MIIKISNKDIHKYKYKRRKAYLKERNIRKNKVSFGDILTKIQQLKNHGVISVSSVSNSISKAVIEVNNKKIH